MSRLIDLCLLAYPRARRERDRVFLRDLALELAERDGLARQALSLLRGGLRDRIAAVRVRPVLVASLVLATLALAASGLVGTTDHEVEHLDEVEQLDAG